MTRDFTVGMRVEFDSEHGSQKGTVIGIKRDIANGEGFAVVEVDHALSGCAWQVPLAKLAPESVSA